MSDGIESQHLRRLMVRAREAREARMTDDVSKPALGDGIPSLPAWPEDPVGEDHPDYESGMYSREYWRLESYAYRARMEALKEYAQHEDGCRAWNPTEDYGHWDLSCNCGLDALLAACHRPGDEPSEARCEREEGR